MLDSMEMRYCPKLAVATPEQQLGVLGLLYLCDQEFLPPLSQRDDTRQKDFLDSIGMGVEAYFAALLEQACLLLLCGTEVAGFLSSSPGTTWTPPSGRSVSARMSPPDAYTQNGGGMDLRVRC